jgi:hypothetical protein
MDEFRFQIEREGSLQEASLCFTTEVDIRRYHRSLSPFARESSKVIRDAVEFTRLAAKRWRYYSRSGEAVESNLRK